jgi:hypothetical protein
MKKFIALFLVISFLGMNCATYERGEGINLSPDQKPGVKLVIQKTDGQQVKGELIAVKQNSLLLKESESGVDVSVETSEIKMIKIVKKSKALEWGVNVGLLMTLLVLAYYEGQSRGWAQPADKMSGAEAVLAIVFYTLPFVGIGALLGRDQKIQIEGKSDFEISSILNYLRKKARVPDF